MFERKNIVKNNKNIYEKERKWNKNHKIFMKKWQKEFSFFSTLAIDFSKLNAFWIFFRLNFWTSSLFLNFFRFFKMQQTRRSEERWAIYQFTWLRILYMEAEKKVVWLYLRHASCLLFIIFPQPVAMFY